MAESGEPFQRHIAAADSPFIALFEHERADEAENGGFVGKMPMTSHLRLISLLTRSIGLVLAICVQCSRGKAI